MTMLFICVLAAAPTAVAQADAADVVPPAMDAPVPSQLPTVIEQAGALPDQQPTGVPDAGPSLACAAHALPVRSGELLGVGFDCTVVGATSDDRGFVVHADFGSRSIGSLCVGAVNAGTGSCSGAALVHGRWPLGVVVSATLVDSGVNLQPVPLTIAVPVRGWAPQP